MAISIQGSTTPRFGWRRNGRFPLLRRIWCRFLMPRTLCLRVE